MPIKEITCLGIASNSFNELNTVSFAVQAEQAWMLIDCGPDTPRALRRLTNQFSAVECVVLTHSHMDHVLGMPYLLFGRNLDCLAQLRGGQTPSPLTVICESSTWNILLELFHKLHPDVPKLSYELRHEEISSGQPKEWQSIQVEAIATIHSVSSYGIVLYEQNAPLFAYSGDTIPCSQFETRAVGARCVVVEGMVPSSDEAFARATKHSTVTDAGQSAKRIGCQRSFMVHIRPNYYNKKELLEKEASNCAGFPMRYPKEGEIIFKNG